MSHISCTVITATTARESLIRCIESVANQGGSRLAKIQHLIMVDGKENHGNAIMIMDEAKRLYGVDVMDHAVFLPDSVGKDRWNGHRIYAAGTYLAEGEYVMFLDDDNTLEPYHIEECLAAVQSGQGKYGWTYSLRRIVDQKGNFICNDDCESLGPDYATVINEQDRLVDVNCYFLHTKLAVFVTPLWYRKAREQGVMEVDRALVQALKNTAGYIGTGKYTVNYTTDSTAISVSSNFFLQGNIIMNQRYPGGFPWRK